MEKELEPKIMRGRLKEELQRGVIVVSSRQNVLIQTATNKQEMPNSIQQFVDYWDKRINEWYQSPDEIVYNGIEASFYVGKQDKELVSNAFPEPYLGDPFSSSCVIINLNPGIVMPIQQNIENGTFVLGWRKTKSYFTFAKQFIYLHPEQKNGFWINRQKWIDRLLEIKKMKSSKRPFALEIIPFHSKSFGRLVYNDDYRNYMLNYLLPVAEEASSCSDLNIIVTVGKSFYETFNWLGFKKVIEYNHKNHPSSFHWPKKNDKTLVQRNFSIWESLQGKFYYNTWHPGGNKMPAENWKNIENQVLTRTRY